MNTCEIPVGTDGVGMELVSYFLSALPFKCVLLPTSVESFIFMVYLSFLLFSLTFFFKM